MKKTNKFIEFFKKVGQFFKNLFRGIKVIDREQWDKIVELSKNKAEKLFDLIDIDNDGKIVIGEIIDTIKKANKKK